RLQAGRAGGNLCRSGQPRAPVPSPNGRFATLTGCSVWARGAPSGVLPAPLAPLPFAALGVALTFLRSTRTTHSISGCNCQFCPHDPGVSVMNPHLFVYGTLLSRVRHPMGVRLRREASLIGAASIQGRLYSLGRYPGLVESADAGDIVHGEAYALN